MNLMIDAFWRAGIYCLHPRVVALSFLPLLLMVVASLGLGFLFWNDAVEAIRLHLQGWAWADTLANWLKGLGLGDWLVVLAPALLLFGTIPFIVVASLLVVALFMVPALVSLVSERRFPALERKRGGSFMSSLLWSAGSTLAACLALLLSVPLWLVPPLVLILPPLIWGWLSYRVMAFDVLADHASASERRELMHAHRLPLLGMGLLTGYLGALPSVLWASGAMFIAMAPVLVPVAIWVYTLVFAFSGLWFAHYALAALEDLRRKGGGPAEVVDVPARPVSESAPAATDARVPAAPARSGDTGS